MENKALIENTELQGQLTNQKTIATEMAKVQDAKMVADNVALQGGDVYFTYQNQFSGYCLVKIKLQHGRTHQIRVHTSSIGHPLLGDCLYGTKSELINHTALVCKELRFIHPTNKESIFLTVPFPDDFNNLISRN